MLFIPSAIKFCYYAISTLTEAYNDIDEEEKGEGRSANHPRERLKVRIFLTVVVLLSLEHWHNAHSANQP